MVSEVKNSIKCPTCGESIIHTEGYKHIVKSSVMFVRGRKTLMECRRCHKEVPVPIKVTS